MPRIDFENNRGENLADPRYDKDAVNYRTFKRELTRHSYLDLTGGTVSGNLTISSTNVLTLTSLKFSESTTQPTAASGLVWYSGGTLYIFTGSTDSDIVALY